MRAPHLQPFLICSGLPSFGRVSFPNVRVLPASVICSINLILKNLVASDPHRWTEKDVQPSAVSAGGARLIYQDHSYNQRHFFVVDQKESKTLIPIRGIKYSGMIDIYDVASKTSSELYYKALKTIPPDVIDKIKEAYEQEDDEHGKRILRIIMNNVQTATEKNLLVCQDTGTPVFLVEMGDVDLSIYKLRKSIQEGVRRATKENFLRPNMVDPLTRKNTGDNTGKSSPIIHFEINEALGKKIKIIAMPKGSGSENMSALAMLSPAEGVQGIKRFVLKSVAQAGGKGCPPYIVGVGVGGNFEGVSFLAKKAALRRLGVHNEDPTVRALEEELFEKVNQLGVGPMGVGGRFTALALNIETAETHISSLPVAVNIQCWRGERAEAVIEPTLEVLSNW